MDERQVAQDSAKAEEKVSPHPEKSTFFPCPFGSFLAKQNVMTQSLSLTNLMSRERRYAPPSSRNWLTGIKAASARLPDEVRMTGDCHLRFCERPKVKSHRQAHLRNQGPRYALTKPVT